jgi:pyruvate/2-oxoglutarate dehydrogenase complex dihydrolipoamide dehydrogenase (E3) component
VGARVALVEQAEQPAGDCLFTGCMPSKSLIAPAQLAHDAHFRTKEVSVRGAGNVLGIEAGA